MAQMQIKMTESQEKMARESTSPPKLVLHQVEMITSCAKSEKKQNTPPPTQIKLEAESGEPSASASPIPMTSPQIDRSEVLRSKNAVCKESGSVLPDHD